MRNITPYNYYTNPPDPQSEDAQKVLAWFKAHGTPADPVLVPGVVTPIPGIDVRPTLSWSWTNPRREFPLLMDVALALNSPEVALTELKSFFEFGDPRVYVPYTE